MTIQSDEKKNNTNVNLQEILSKELGKSIIVRNDKTTVWQNSTYKLEKGELGIGYYDNGKVIVKIGAEDGSKTWKDCKQVEDILEKDLVSDVAGEDEEKAELEEIKSEIEKLKADPDTSVADLEGLERSVYNIFTAAEACFNGYHKGLRYELTEEAKCGKNAVESATCSFCGKVLTREVENSALKHSFTKYEVTQEAKCGVEGKEVAACDHGCGETDEKAIEALRHSFTKYEVTEEAKCGVAGKEVAACDNGCGATDEKAIAALTHTDADGDYKCDNGCGHEFENPADACDHLCHKGGFMGFIWKIVRFFQKLFKMNPVCECGAAHY